MNQNPVSFRLDKKRSNVAKKLPILRKNAENKFSLNKSWKETVTKQMEKILLKKFLFILRRRLPAPPTRPLNSHKVESYFPLWLPGDQCLCVDNQESNPWHWICFSKEHISEDTVPLEATGCQGLGQDFDLKLVLDMSWINEIPQVFKLVWNSQFKTCRAVETAVKLVQKSPTQTRLKCQNPGLTDLWMLDWV